VSSLRSASRSRELGAGAAGASEPLLQQIRPRYVTETSRVECKGDLLR
jgi:hypothetical protein